MTSVNDCSPWLPGSAGTAGYHLAPSQPLRITLASYLADAATVGTASNLTVAAVADKSDADPGPRIRCIFRSFERKRSEQVLGADSPRPSDEARPSSAPIDAAGPPPSHRRRSDATF